MKKHNVTIRQTQNFVSFTVDFDTQEEALELVNRISVGRATVLKRVNSIHFDLVGWSVHWVKKK